MMRPTGLARGRTAVSALMAVVLLGSVGTGTRAADPEPLFTDVAEAVGLDFVHFNGMTGAFYYPEMVGGGGAVLDYDNDGDLDVFVVQGTPLDRAGTAPGPWPGDRLYRNDLVVRADGNRELRFVDVTESSGIVETGYGMGATAGDFDNDGWVDLYVLNYGANLLWRNNGDGTFSDVTAASGTGDPHWSIGAAFFDFDRDGLLDLFVANYVEYSVQKNPTCYARSSRQDYCGPSAFRPVGDRLFHNLGEGRFEDVTSRALGRHAAGAGMGVVATDFNGDDRIDIYVTNDGLPNHLWINGGDGRFVDDALLAGAAVNREGRAEASMGVDAADMDGDGDEDLFITHLMGETNTLYVNDGTGLFEDRTREAGLAVASTPFTAFGTAWFDYDNDGWMDLLVLNGAVRVIESLADRGDAYPLRQPNQLFRNEGGRGFAEVTRAAGPALALAEVSRGAAFGDLDNDGDTDVLVFNNHGRLRLLRNDTGNRVSWSGLRLVTAQGRRDALGARVRLRREGRPDLWRRVRTDGSYASANDPRVLFGLGAEPGGASGELTILWPDGSREQRPATAFGRYVTLVQGSDRAGAEATDAKQ